MPAAAILSLTLLSACAAVSSVDAYRERSSPSRPLGRTLLIANGSASTGAVTTFGTVTKDARNPLLKIGAQRKVDQDPKRPWSTGGIYSAIVVDQTGQRSGKPWRAYFTAGLNWTLSPQCPPGATCETGAAGLLYAESEDGIAWEQPNVGLMWPPSAVNGTQQTRSDILRLVEAGAAVFEDNSPAVRAGKSDEEWSIKLVGQLSMKDDSKMHSGGSGEYLTSSDGRTFDGGGTVDVDGGRTPGARWDTENNFFFDHSTGRYVGAMRAPRDPHCGIWWPSCLKRCSRCGAGNLTDQRNGLVSVRAISLMQSNNSSFDSKFTDNVVSVHPTPTEQLYSMVTFPSHGVYFGLVSVADVYEKPFPVGTYNGKPAFGHVNRVHCALQWSRDLLHWEPVENLKDFIPLEWTKWDSHLCYASASPVVMKDGTVRLYYGGSSGPHDGVNATTRLGLATLKSSDRWVGFRQATIGSSAIVRVSVVCKGATLLIGADLPGDASLRVGATDVHGLGLADAIELKAVDADGPDVTAKFKSGKTFSAQVGKMVELALELSNGARAFSVAWV